MDFFYLTDIVGGLPYVTMPFWSQMLVGGLCFALVYVFQAVGLYTIACNNGYKHKWMAFLPFLNTFYIGYVAQKNRCFRWLNTITLAIIVAVFEFVLVAGYIVQTIGSYLVRDYVEYTTETIYGLTVSIKSGYSASLPSSLVWASWVDWYLTEILSWVHVVFEVAKLFLLVTFFQTYSARRYFLFSIFSVIFPIQGIIIFVVRNNKGLNYQEYLRAEQERRYRMYQQYQQQYPPQNDNPYSQNPYSRNDPPAGGQPKDDPSGDPFGGEGASKPEGNDDPFDGFDKH